MGGLEGFRVFGIGDVRFGAKGRGFMVLDVKFKVYLRDETNLEVLGRWGGAISVGFERG